MRRQSLVMVMGLLSLAACQERGPAAPAWAERQQGWAQAEAELRSTAEPLCAELDRDAARGDVAHAELAIAVRGALDELTKSRLTVSQEVQRGVMTPDDAIARITAALAKAERRVEQAAASRREQAPEADETSGDDSAEPAPR
ncbi:MAG: hypothetical protein Q8S33_19080 [Myxococcales bacterium]|nr:hypothetical protein [Myxococcales bacterium]MDP3502448.1 hypothetical protein [Myxococcales bacterium]